VRSAPGSSHSSSTAREAGTDRFVAQSFASFRTARKGAPVKTEDDPLDPAPPASMRASSDAMRYLEEVVTSAGGIVLRYGLFYGAANDGLIDPVRKRQYPIIGEGGRDPGGARAHGRGYAQRHGISAAVRRRRSRPFSGVRSGAPRRGRRRYRASSDRARAPGRGSRRRSNPEVDHRLRCRWPVRRGRAVSPCDGAAGA
jgi:hypothetical protein